MELEMELRVNYSLETEQNIDLVEQFNMMEKLAGPQNINLQTILTSHGIELTVATHYDGKRYGLLFKLGHSDMGNILLAVNSLNSYFTKMEERFIDFRNDHGVPENEITLMLRSQRAKCGICNLVLESSVEEFERHVASHRKDEVEKDIVTQTTIGNKSAAELNKEFKELSRQVQEEVSRCSEQETPNCNDGRKNKDQVWINDPNEDESSSEFNTDAKDSDTSRNGDKEILNQENVAMNMTAENDRSEGELSDSSSDELDSENVDSMLEESLRQSKQHSYQTDCNKNYDDLNYHIVMSGKGDVFLDPPRSPSPLHERHEWHERKRKHSSPRQSRNRRQRSKSPHRLPRRSYHTEHRSSSKQISMSSNRSRSCSSDRSTCGSPYRSRSRSKHRYRSKSPPRSRFRHRSKSPSRSKFQHGSRSSENSLFRPGHRSSSSASRSPHRAGSSSPELSLSLSEKSGSFLKEAPTKQHIMDELIQMSEKVPREVKTVEQAPENKEVVTYPLTTPAPKTVQSSVATNLEVAKTQTVSSTVGYGVTSLGSSVAVMTGHHSMSFTGPVPTIQTMPIESAPSQPPVSHQTVYFGQQMASNMVQGMPFTGQRMQLNPVGYIPNPYPGMHQGVNWLQPGMTHIAPEMTTAGLQETLLVDQYQHVHQGVPHMHPVENVLPVQPILAGPRPQAMPFGYFPNPSRFPPPSTVRTPVATNAKCVGTETREKLIDKTNIPDSLHKPGTLPPKSGYSDIQSKVQINSPRPELYTSSFLPRMGQGPTTHPRIQPYPPDVASHAIPAHTKSRRTVSEKDTPPSTHLTLTNSTTVTARNISLVASTTKPAANNQGSNSASETPVLPQVPKNVQHTGRKSDEMPSCKSVLQKTSYRTGVIRPGLLRDSGSAQATTSSSTATKNITVPLHLSGVRLQGPRLSKNKQYRFDPDSEKYLEYAIHWVQLLASQYETDVRYVAEKHADESERIFYESYNNYGKLKVFIGIHLCGTADLQDGFLPSAQRAAARALVSTHFQFDLVPGILASTLCDTNLKWTSEGRAAMYEKPITTNDVFKSKASAHQLSKNKQYTDCLRESMYKIHVVEWVQLLAYQNEVSVYFSHSQGRPFRAHIVFNGRVDRTQLHGNSIQEAKENAAVDFLMNTSVTFKNLPIELGGTARVNYRKSVNFQYSLNYTMDCELLDSSLDWLKELENQIPERIHFASCTDPGVSGLCVIIGMEKHTCSRKILKYKDYRQIDIVKRFAALEALMSTKYRFARVPEGLQRKSSSYRMYQPRYIGEIMKLSKLGKPRKPVSTMARVKLSANEQYKIDILDPQYKEYLWQWVILLATQNELSLPYTKGNPEMIHFDEEVFEGCSGETEEETKILQSARILMETKFTFNPIPELLAGPAGSRLTTVPVIPMTDQQKSQSGVTGLNKNSSTSSISASTCTSSTTCLQPKEKTTLNLGGVSPSTSKTGSRQQAQKKTNDVEAGLSSIASKNCKATDHSRKEIDIKMLIGSSSLTKRKKREKTKRAYIESDDSDDEYQEKKKPSKRKRIESDSDDDFPEKIVKPKRSRKQSSDDEKENYQKQPTGGNRPTVPTVRCTVDLLRKRTSRNGQFRIAALSEKRSLLQDFVDDLEEQNGVALKFEPVWKGNFTVMWATFGEETYNVFEGATSQEANKLGLATVLMNTTYRFSTLPDELQNTLTKEDQKKKRSMSVGGESSETDTNDIPGAKKKRDRDSGQSDKTSSKMGTNGKAGTKDPSAVADVLFLTDTRTSNQKAKSQKNDKAKMNQSSQKNDKGVTKRKRIDVLPPIVNDDGTCISNNGQYCLDMSKLSELYAASGKWIETLCRQNKIKGTLRQNYIKMGEEKHTLKQTGDCRTNTSEGMGRTALQALLATGYKFKKIPSNLQAISINRHPSSSTESDVICIDDSPVSGNEKSVPVTPVMESSLPLKSVMNISSGDQSSVTGSLLSPDSRGNGTQNAHIVTDDESSTHSEEKALTSGGEDQNVNPSLVMCQAHKNMICDNFCETCAVDICIMCTIDGDHEYCDTRSNNKTEISSNILGELRRKEERTSEKFSEAGGGHTREGSVIAGSDLQEAGREFAGNENRGNEREAQPHSEREDHSRLVQNNGGSESVRSNTLAGTDDRDTDVENVSTDIEQSFIVLDSWTNEKETPPVAESKSPRSPIRAVMRTGMHLAKNEQYKLDLSDENLQNNFVKWLDILADQNGVMTSCVQVESEQKSFRLEIGSESYLSTASDTTQARILAAGEALLKTSYDFTQLPADLKSVYSGPSKNGQLNGKDLLDLDDHELCCLIQSLRDQCKVNMAYATHENSVTLCIGDDVFTSTDHLGRLDRAKRKVSQRTLMCTRYAFTEGPKVFKGGLTWKIPKRRVPKKQADPNLRKSANGQYWLQMKHSIFRDSYTLWVQELAKQNKIKIQWTSVSVAAQGYVSRRLILGDESHPGKGTDPNSAKIAAAEKALMQTKYKFTEIPLVLPEAPWMMSNESSDSESLDDGEESVTNTRENTGTSVSRSPVRPQRPPSAELEQVLGTTPSHNDNPAASVTIGDELPNIVDIQPMVITPDASDLSQLTNTNEASVTACGPEESPSEGVLYPPQIEYGVTEPSSAMSWSPDANVIVIKPEPNMMDDQEETNMESWSRSLAATAVGYGIDDAIEVTSDASGDSDIESKDEADIQGAFEDDDCMIVDVPKTPPRVIDVTEDDHDEFNRGVKKLKVARVSRCSHKLSNNAQYIRFDFDANKNSVNWEYHLKELGDQNGVKSAIKVKNNKWFCELHTEFYYGPLGDLEKKKLLYKALMETNYAFSVLPAGPFRDNHPLTECCARRYAVIKSPNVLAEAKNVIILLARQNQINLPPPVVSVKDDGKKEVTVFLGIEEYAVEGMIETEKLRGMAYLTALQGTTYNFATLPETVAFCDYRLSAYTYLLRERAQGLDDSQTHSKIKIYKEFLYNAERAAIDSIMCTSVAEKTNQKITVKESDRVTMQVEKTCQYLDERVVETIRAEGGAGINRVPNQPLTVQKMTPPAAKRSSSTGSSAATNTQAKQMAPPAIGGVRSSTGSSAATSTQALQMAPPLIGVRSSTGSSAATSTQALQMAPPAARGVRSSSAAASTQAKQMAPPVARGVRSSSNMRSSAAATAASVQPGLLAGGQRQRRSQRLVRPQPQVRPQRQVASTSSTSGADNPWEKKSAAMMAVYEEMKKVINRRDFGNLKLKHSETRTLTQKIKRKYLSQSEKNKMAQELAQIQSRIKSQNAHRLSTLSWKYNVEYITEHLKLTCRAVMDKCRLT